MPHLVGVTLQEGGAIVCAQYGNFSEASSEEGAASTESRQELAIARVGGRLELIRPEATTGKLVVVGSTRTFCCIRSMRPFRLTGSTRDYLVIGSDSGTATVAEFKDGEWRRAHCEAFGKTGCRRAVPGQFVACDPRGRACMVAAVEKQKFVYVLNRDASHRLTISSPLEAHKAQTIVFDVCAVDVGFENPVFAVLELDYAEAEQDPSGDAARETEKMLTYYELDLGLNHVSRRWSEPVSRTANLLAAAPGGDDGPSGVVVCGENWVAYKKEDHAEVRTPLPRRADWPEDRGLLAVAVATHKQRDLFFFLMLSEVGDLYKMSLNVSVDDYTAVTDVIVSVFDTIFPASSLCITRTGYLFAAADFGDHALFQFRSLDDDNAVSAHAVHDPELGDDATGASKVAPVFFARPELRNLELVDELESLAAPADLRVLAPPPAAPDAEPGLVACRGGHRPALDFLRRGAAAAEMAVSNLPGRPSAVWTVRARQDAIYDKYIVVSFTNATLVLSIGETVEEVTDSGFLANAATLEVCLLADNALLQVYADGVRVVRPDADVREWKPPGNKTIDKASANERQVACAFGAEVVYFELDASGALAEKAFRDLAVDVACLDVAPVPSGKLRAPFLCVGHFDATLKILALDPDDLLTPVASVAVGDLPETVKLLSVTVKDGAIEDAEDSYVLAGLKNGVCYRLALDGTTGALKDPTSRFLGVRPVRLVRCLVAEKPALLALSSKPWLVAPRFTRGGAGPALRGPAALVELPVAYDTLDFAASFRSEQCPEAVVAVAGDTLRIFVVDLKSPDQAFHSLLVPTLYTPRMCVDLPAPDRSLLLVIEADQHRYSQAEAHALAAASCSKTGGHKDNNKNDKNDDDDNNNNNNPDSTADADVAAAVVPEETTATTTGDAGRTTLAAATPATDDDAMDIAADNDEAQPPLTMPRGPANAAEAAEAAAEDDEEAAPPLRIVGPTPPGVGKWASCLRVLDPLHPEDALELLELAESEAAVSCATCVFAGRPTAEVFVAVGTAKSLRFGTNGRSHDGCFIHIYRLLESRLVLLHKTPLEDVPVCLANFRGRLLVTVGRAVRLYDLGKRKLLRKTENVRLVPNLVVCLAVAGDRLYVCDATESVAFCRHVSEINKLAVFADDPVSRAPASLCIVDYDTVALGDKFGNIILLRLAVDADDNVDDPSGHTLYFADAQPNVHKLQIVATFHVGAIVTAITKTTLASGADDALFFTAVDGRLGALVPSKTRDDKDFFTMLEMHLRQDYPHFITRRDHISFRSAFAPVKDIVDGDLCLEFPFLTRDLRASIASDLERSPHEVYKKILDTIHRLL